MHIETVTYFHGNVALKGFIAYEEEKNFKRPAVLVTHAWRGQDAFAKEKAIALAKLGYLGFAVDMYGEGKHTKDSDEAASLMMPFFLNRKLLQDRIYAAFSFIQKHPLVDANRIGAIGFCFGGLIVIELFRSGADVKAVVSFHGLLGNQLAGRVAKTVPIAKSLPGSLLILHGQDDPLVSAEDILGIQKELTNAHADWQMHIYGGTMHAFTNPEANDVTKGTVFHPTSCKRAWNSMEEHFQETFFHKK